MHRLAIFVMLGSLVLGLSVGALATEDSGEGETTETTVAATSDYSPAVTVAPEVPNPDDEPWTTRYLIPTGLLLGALAVFVTVIQYFVRVVRNRYKVIE